MNKNSVISYREWYQKKRYLLPLTLILGVWIGSGLTSSPSTTDYPITQAPAASYLESSTSPSSAIEELPSYTPTPTPPESFLTELTEEENLSFPESDTTDYQYPEETDSVPLSNNNYYTNSEGEVVHSPAYAPSIPDGASAICGDGTYSFSRSSRGTCSHHGGVAEWL